ncbi:virulence factor SrfB, partial [Enterobacter cloacae]|uniref:virulence factor SrfB n=1 Tax=Enterobacter cloacae TaxID=550 RepID=UPI0029DD08D5
SFEYQDHWLNVMTMLGEQLNVTEVKFVTHTLITPAITVDLILDVGNTQTSGVNIEYNGDANDGLSQTAELQERSLSE